MKSPPREVREIEGRRSNRRTMSAPDVAICSVARTPIGRFMGSLSRFTAVELGTLAASEALNRLGVDPRSGVVDEVLMGQVLQAGAGQNPARQVALGAGLPVTTPAVTINKVCGSSLKATMIGATAIRAGSIKWSLRVEWNRCPMRLTFS